MGARRGRASSRYTGGGGSPGRAMQARDRRRLKLCLFLWGTGEGLFVYLLPLYIRSLGGGATAVGLNFAIQFAVAGASTLLAGPPVDRLAPRPLHRATGPAPRPGAVTTA